MRPSLALWLVPFGIGALAGAAFFLASEPPGAPPPSASPEAAGGIAIPIFVDRAREAGLFFAHESGARGERYLPETMGAGAVWLDHDGDGRPDLFAVQSGGLPPGRPAGAGSRLFRQTARGRFEDVTEAAGIDTRACYGQGAIAADYDGDGHVDLYLTNFGPNVLYRNRGDGTFEDVTARAGVAAGGWSTAAVFFDYDRDGHLDLFVGRYLDLATDLSNHKPCVTEGHRTYCTPLDYPPLPPILYHNEGDGTFRDVTAAALRFDVSEAKTLGAVAADLDLDGWPDLYVANDLQRALLFRNRGDGTFEEVGLRAGVALSEEGRAQAGMGVAAADWDGDGRIDLARVNYQDEANCLYRNLTERPGDLFFSDEAQATGFGPAGLKLLKFGCAFFDLDLDGRLDFAVANGHVMDNIERFSDTGTWKQRLLLLWQTEGSGGRPRFLDMEGRAGPAIDERRVWRGLAVADYDCDGDEDLAVTANGGALALLRAEGGGRGGWIRLALEGSGRSNRSAIGARVVVTAGGRRTAREVQAGTSYLGSNELPLTFGLGAARAADVEVRWPSGEVERWAGLAAGRAYRLRAGSTPEVETIK